MADIKFTREHEWVRIDGETGVVGITEHAQEQLGDLVFVELPEIGRNLDQGDEAGVVESVKAASEIYSPVGGEVTGINEALNDDPSLVNSDPMGEGWFYTIKLSDTGELEGLMDKEAYDEYVAGLD